jgi:hypothetical protein
MPTAVTESSVDNIYRFVMVYCLSLIVIVSKWSWPYNLHGFFSKKHLEQNTEKIIKKVTGGKHGHPVDVAADVDNKCLNMLSFLCYQLFIQLNISARRCK